MRCSVLSCSSYSESKIPGISFHSFPDNPELRNLWIAFTERINWAPKPSSRLCGLHFASKLLRKRGKKTFLHHDAVPDKLTDFEFVSVNDGDPIPSTSYIAPIKMEKSETRSQADAINNCSASPDFSPQTLKKKLKNAQKTSGIRLKKLKSLREKGRRLTKKVSDLETVLAEIKSKQLVSEEDLDFRKNVLNCQQVL